MKTPHVHAAVIKAWADGAEIQVKGESPTSKWEDLNGCQPLWHSKQEYRVKPEPKPDSILLRRIEFGHGINIDINQPNVKFTFDGETGKLKGVKLI